MAEETYTLPEPLGPATTSSEYTLPEPIGPASDPNYVLPEPIGPAEGEEETGVFSVMSDIAKGAVRAPISVLQGIGELGGAGIDYVFDTNTARYVTETGEDVKQALGIDELGAAGEITDEIGSFLIGFIPVAGWLGRAGSVARGAQGVASSGRFLRSAEAVGRAARGSAIGRSVFATRPGLIGTTALGSGVVETLVSPEGRSTIADNFEFLPESLRTEEYDALDTGSENAARIIRNRLRRASEAALLSGAFDTALLGAGAGIRAAATAPVIGPGISAAVRGTNRYVNLGAQKLSTVPGIKGATQLFNRYFSPSRGGDPVIFEELQDVIASGDAASRRALRQYNKVEQAFAELPRIMRRSGEANPERASAQTYDYLTGNKSALDMYQLPDGSNPVRKAADDALKIMNTYQDDLLGSLSRAKESADTTFQQNRIQSVIDEIETNRAANMGYLNRLFTMYEPGEARKFYENLDLTSKEFDDVVDEVQNFMGTAVTGGRSTLGDQYVPGFSDLAPQVQRREAQRIVYEILGLKATDQIGPQAALKNVREALKQELRGGEGVRGVVASRRPVLNISEEMFIERKPIIDNNPLLRAFMGEIKDPKKLYVTSINKMAKTSAAGDFYRNVARSGNAVSIDKAVDQIAQGGRPLVVRMDMSPERLAVQTPSPRGTEALPRGYMAGTDPVTALREQEAFLKNEGYVRLGDELNPNSVFGGEYGALTGMYVPQEMANMFTAPLELGLHPASELFAVLNQFRGLSQKALIVPNLPSRVRDILGNASMLAANANIPRNMDFAAMFQTLLGDMANLDDAGLARLVRKIELSGTQNTNLLISALREFIGEGKQLGFAGKTAKAIEKAESLPVYKQLDRFFTALAEGSDNFFKAIAVLSEEAKFTEALTKAGVNVSKNDPFFEEIMASFVNNGLVRRVGSEVLAELNPIEVMAAEIAKDTMPTYNRVGAFIRGLDRFPLFGNFMSFASENIRNSVNIVGRALREMAYEVEPALRQAMGEQRAAILERNIRALGAQRLASYMSVAVVAPSAMVKAGMMSTGMTEDDMNRVYDLSQDYLRDQMLVPIEYDGEGKVKFVNLSYVAPYGFVTDSANAALREYARQGRLGKSEAEAIASGMWASFTSYTDPFASEAIIYERIRDVLPSSGPMSLGIGRGGVTATGAKIYEQSAPLGDKISAGFLHVVDSLAPAYINLLAEVRGGEIRPGRMSRAFFEVPGSRGQEYDVYEEIARQFTGFTPLELNMNRDFEFNGLEYTELRNEAKGAANRALTASDRTVEEMISGYADSMDALYNTQSLLYSQAQAAISLYADPEVGRRRVFRQLKAAGLGNAEINNILDGRFYPRPVSRETVLEVSRQLREEGRARLVDQLPVQEINALVRERMGQPLRPVAREPDRESNLSRMIRMETTVPEGAYQLPEPIGPANVQGAAPAAPVVGSMPVAPVPQPSVPQARSQPPSLDLLGSNPLEALRNLGIAQRTSGQ